MTVNFSTVQIDKTTTTNRTKVVREKNVQNNCTTDCVEKLSYNKHKT